MLPCNVVVEQADAWSPDDDTVSVKHMVKIANPLMMAEVGDFAIANEVLGEAQSRLTRVVEALGKLSADK